MKLNMYADFTFKIPFEDRLMLIKDSGFDGVMLGFSEGLMYTQYETADRFGLEIENVHSPFDRMNALWELCPVSEYILNRTLECIDVCSENGVRKVVVHPTDGLVPPKAGKFGLNNFDKLINEAAKKNVRLLFENIQIPQFLNIIFDNFGHCGNVGFCYDVGHENCFSKGTDCLSEFARRLEALHIHDNDGSSDGHLIPYDGNIDYDKFLKKLSAASYGGPISLEVYMGKSDKYAEYTCKSFVSKAARAGRYLAEKYSILRRQYEQISD